MSYHRNLIVVLCLCISSVVYASDYTYVPDITTFDKKDYSAGRQNWDIEVDKDNVIYIANNEGLLRYVYGQWILDELPSGKSLRTVCHYKNKIWCGGDEIGFFNIDESGKLSYEHLSDINGNVWNIETNGDNVFFQSNNVITVYRISTKSLVQYTFPKRLSGLGKWNNKIWTINGDNGIGTLDVDGFNFVQPFPQGQEQEVRVLFEHNDKLFIVMFDGQIFAYDGSRFEKINLPEQTSCFSAVHYDENTLFIGSILEGIIPVKTRDEQLTYQRKIQNKDGLLDNTVLSLAVDNNGNLWAGLDYGIAKINKESLLKSIISKGATYDIEVNDATTYVATNKGLYTNYLSNDFTLVTGTQGQVWALNESASGIFACHNNGLIKVKNNTSQLVFDKTGVMDVAQFGNSKNYLFSAYTGTLWMQEINGEYIERQNLWLWGNPKLSYDKSNKCVWAYGGSGNIAVHYIKINDDTCAVNETSMQNVFSTGNGLFFYDGNKIFEYIDETFVESRMALTRSIVGEGISTLEVSPENNIAVFIQNEEVKMIEELADGSTIVHGKLLSEVNNDIIEQFECLKIRDKLLYIATEQGVKVLPLSLRNNSQTLKNPIISKIEITDSENNNPNLIYYPYTNQELTLASRQFKTITLSFANKKKQNIEYRYRLLPYNKEWSEWSFTQKQVAYGDLKPRQYTFELQCRYNGTIERETMLPIKIEGIGYYYLRIGILVFVFLALSLIILQYGKNKKLSLRHKYYQKISAEEQIQSKKEQLLQFTEVIRHKNSFLVEVRGALSQMKNSAAARWVNKIDDEINKEKKEFLFHKVFSEDQQDFIKRITSKYEGLTSHDVRLLSFIRINANTSEIAQFLNISTSSVDTARYRLRKKLNLEHVQNLNTFIREF
ncbi:two-component regulator propeller domain-containing protein [Carboxylicivirga marina]|uniref:two-component regulator propeller domain-containing protein n=1 Tax=Carboxylicivirga marina TaxID=2800988 RepID=UPI0025976FC7|nr:two-component regulator propeller domain-containing protein [uncultured Carboxylicivirga sp.]